MIAVAGAHTSRSRDTFSRISPRSCGVKRFHSSAALATGWTVYGRVVGSLVNSRATISDADSSSAYSPPTHASAASIRACSSVPAIPTLPSEAPSPPEPAPGAAD